MELRYNPVMFLAAYRKMCFSRANNFQYFTTSTHSRNVSTTLVSKSSAVRALGFSSFWRLCIRVNETDITQFYLESDFRKIFFVFKNSNSKAYIKYINSNSCPINAKHLRHF